MQNICSILMLKDSYDYTRVTINLDIFLKKIINPQHTKLQIYLTNGLPSSSMQAKHISIMAESYLSGMWSLNC